MAEHRTKLQNLVRDAVKTVNTFSAEGSGQGDGFSARRVHALSCKPADDPANTDNYDVLEPLVVRCVE